MKLILTQEVNGLGAAGDVVDVKPGYGRNYLLPRNFAVVWTKGGQKQVDSIRKARVAREIASLDEAKQIKATLEADAVRVPVKAGNGGRLFGAVKAADIANAVVASGGPKIDRRKIEMPQSIKTLGAHTVGVRLHADVAANVKINVVAG